MQINERANILTEALPYIQQFYNKTIVVKYGGNAMVSEELKRAVISDVVLLNLVGVNVVLVHGGGPEISDMLKKTGKESKFIDGLRYTDEDTIDIVQMVLAGKINKDLVSMIGQLGGKAAGICGLDGALFKAERLKGAVDYGYVGDIKEVDTSIVESLIEKKYIPVVATVAQGTDGATYNINADTAAAKLASALHAEKLILLTDIAGLLRDPSDESTVISKVPISEAPKLMRDGVISGGMIPKIECCVEAVRRGVKRSHIIDGRVPHSILIEMFSDGGIGTMIL